MRSISFEEATGVGGGMIGAPTGPNGIPLLSAGGLSPQELNSPMSCEAFANDSTTRVTGIAGVLFPIDAALDIMFGDGWKPEVNDWFYEGCMSRGIYGTNENLDTYDYYPPRRG